MSSVRLIDGSALLAMVDGTFPDTNHTAMFIVNCIRTAPTVTLQPAEGDAISREAAIEALRATPHTYDLENTAVRQLDQDIRLIANLPSLPATPTPDVDRVTAEDVVEGIEFRDEDGAAYQVCGDGGGSKWFTVYGTCPTDSSGAEVERDLDDKLCLPMSLIAAMLNAAESITYPEGHRLAPKKEPTLLEAATEFMQGNKDMDALRMLQAAIEREKGGEGV